MGSSFIFAVMGTILGISVHGNAGTFSNTTVYEQFANFDSEFLEELRDMGLRKLGDISSGNTSVHVIKSKSYQIVLPEGLSPWALEKIQRGVDREGLEELGIEILSETTDPNLKYEMQLSYGFYSQYRSGQKQQRQASVKLEPSHKSQAQIYCGENQTHKQYTIVTDEKSKAIGELETCDEVAYVTRLCTGDYHENCEILIDEDGNGFEVILN